MNVIYESAVNAGVVAKGEIGLVKTAALTSIGKDESLDGVGDAPDVAAVRSRLVKV